MAQRLRLHPEIRKESHQPVRTPGSPGVRGASWSRGRQPPFGASPPRCSSPGSPPTASHNGSPPDSTSDRLLRSGRFIAGAPVVSAPHIQPARTEFASRGRVVGVGSEGPQRRRFLLEHRASVVKTWGHTVFLGPNRADYPRNACVYRQFSEEQLRIEFRQPTDRSEARSWTSVKNHVQCRSFNCFDSVLTADTPETGLAARY